jgi:hypothetical protein
MNSGKRVIGGLAAALFCAMFASAAEASPWGFGHKRQESWKSDLQPARQNPESADEQTKHRPRHSKKGMHQRGRRLSPEEHSQLRRDIKDAGKEIYPAPDAEHPAP